MKLEKNFSLINIVIKLPMLSNNIKETFLLNNNNNKLTKVFSYMINILNKFYILLSSISIIIRVIISLLVPSQILYKIEVKL